MNAQSLHAYSFLHKTRRAAEGKEMIKQIVGVSVLAASLVAAGNAPVHADAAADGLAKAK